jgi:flagellar P-ring protein FlgI
MRRLMLLLATLLGIAAPAQAERIKDLAGFAGIRSNQLVGYGLVVGLNGTGDDNLEYVLQSMRSAISRFGVVIPPTVKPSLKNAAAVMITADLPPFAKPGQNIDVTVSAIGKAKSLRGGSLLLAPLLGADGQVYAMSQGSLAVGGLGVEGQDGSKITVNIPTSGRIPEGATVERMVETPFGTAPSMVLNLRQADFTTAQRVSDAINRTLGAGAAQAMDAVSVRVTAPQNPEQRISMVSVVENIEVTPAEAAARVVVNSRTGTVVIGANVRVSPAAITHGSMTVKVTENPQVSQPSPFSRGGQTAVVPDSGIDVKEGSGHMFLFKPGVALDDIVKSVNALGASPGDLVAILEALKQAGALKAELIVI